MISRFIQNYYISFYSKFWYLELRRRSFLISFVIKISHFTQNHDILFKIIILKYLFFHLLIKFDISFYPKIYILFKNKHLKVLISMESLSTTSNNPKNHVWLLFLKNRRRNSNTRIRCLGKIIKYNFFNSKLIYLLKYF